MQMVHWTPELLERLRASTQAALTAGDYQFVLDDMEFVTSYAVHLIEYLDELFGHSTTVH